MEEKTTKKCKDCGEKDIYNYLRPPFIPPKIESGFCEKCYKERLEDFWKKRPMRLIGQRGVE